MARSHAARRTRRYGSVMGATHYAVSTSAAQQKALVEIRQAEKYMGSTPGTRRARKLYEDGDFTGAAHVAHQAFLADRRHGNMKFDAGYPLPTGSKFKISVRTLQGMPHVWYVSGPRVLRGGRVDYHTSAYYGTINKKTGELHVWGGKGAAGEHYRIYLETVRDRLKRRLHIASRRTGEPLVRVARQARGNLVITPPPGPSAAIRRFAVRRVRLDRGGYDRHGRYFGGGERLWHVEDQQTGRGMHVRASGAKAARAEAMRRPHHWGGWR